MKSPMGQAATGLFVVLVAAFILFGSAVIWMNYFDDNQSGYAVPVAVRSSETEETTETETETVSYPDIGLSFRSDGDGKCTLIGIGECRDTILVIPSVSPTGEIVAAIAPRAFYENGRLCEVSIPSSVESIGALAFAGCAALGRITVEEDNPAYCDRDGVLYTKDQGTLILYPSARAGESMTFPRLTTEVSEMAFYGCLNLGRILYEGSAEEWERIRIGSRNYSLTAAAKTFGWK